MTKVKSISKILKGTAGIFALGMAFSFLFNWAITKVMSQEDVGFYQYFISIITLAMVIIPLGYQSLAQREATSLGRLALNNFSKQAAITILSTAILFSFIWYYGVTRLNWVKGLNNFNGLRAALLVIPIYSLNTFFKSVLQSQNKVYQSIIPDVLIRPALLLLSLLILPFLGLGINPETLLYVLSCILLCSLIYAIVNSFKKITIGDFNNQPKWFKQALLLLPIGLLYTLNERIDIVMISKMLGPIDNAIYGVAFKFAAFSGFGIVILNQVLVPQYAKHFKEKGNVNELQKIIKPNVRKSFFLSSLVLILLLLFGKNILTLFGKSINEYTSGFATIIILSFGQLFNVAVGSVGYILTMAKLEKYVFVGLTLGIISNLILNSLLVPKFGIQGAAIATSTSMILWNVVMLYFVIRKTKINPTIL